MEWIKIIFDAVVSALKGIFGTDKPVKKTIEHPEPDIKVDDGKDDKARLKDLGL